VNHAPYMLHFYPFFIYFFNIALLRVSMIQKPFRDSLNKSFVKWNYNCCKKLAIRKMRIKFDNFFFIGYLAILERVSMETNKRRENKKKKKTKIKNGSSKLHQSSSINRRCHSWKPSPRQLNWYQRRSPFVFGGSHMHHHIVITSLIS